MPKKDTKLENLSKTVHMLAEKTRLSELENLDYIFMEHYYTQLAGMMIDSRVKCGILLRIFWALSFPVEGFCYHPSGRIAGYAEGNINPDGGNGWAASNRLRNC